MADTASNIQKRTVRYRGIPADEINRIGLNRPRRLGFSDAEDPRPSFPGFFVRAQAGEVVQIV
jgi:hypothetical protein